MKKDVRELLKLAKKILAKGTYNKLRKIGDEEELGQAIRYALIVALEREHHRVEKEIEIMEKKVKDVFFMRNKSILVPSKIKHFAVDFDKDEFYKVFNLLNDIKREMKNA